MAFFGMDFDGKPVDPDEFKRLKYASRVLNEASLELKRKPVVFRDDIEWFDALFLKTMRVSKQS